MACPILKNFVSRVISSNQKFYVVGGIKLKSLIKLLLVYIEFRFFLESPLDV